MCPPLRCAFEPAGTSIPGLPRWGRLPFVAGVNHFSKIILVGLALLLVPSACASKGASTSGKPDERWKVTWQIDVTEDHGGGTVGRYKRVIIATPAEIRESTAGEMQGKPFSRESHPTPLDDERRQAVSALLPRLKGQAGSYSTGLERGDEGFYGVSLTVEIDGEVWRFELDDGTTDPRPPAALNELQRLIFGKESHPDSY
jgi:hypothetical protein